MELAKPDIEYHYVNRYSPKNNLLCISIYWRSYHLCPECIWCTPSIRNVHSSFTLNLAKHVRVRIYTPLYTPVYTLYTEVSTERHCDSLKLKFF